MKQAVWMLAVGLVIAHFSLPVAAQPVAGQREFTLSGSGISDSGFDNNTFGASASLGWFRSEALEWGVRQDLGVADSENDDVTITGSTRLFVDWHLVSPGPWRPFVGGSIGAVYGENVDEDFILGPEAGVKYYLQPSTFIQLQAAYQFRLGEDIDDGSTFYTLGLGYNF